MNIANTGERILLEKETPLMIARHLKAYRFTKDFVSGKTVLDIGCGEGYGSYFLADLAEEVTGVDYDKEVIEFAKSKYQKDNLHFIAQNAERLDSIKGGFGVICSFQCIEHILDVDSFLKNINNLLAGKGIFICSTPNKKDATPKGGAPFNKFHIKEYLLDEFRQLLSGYFNNVEIVGVKRGKKLNFYRALKKMGIFNFLPQQLDPVKNFYSGIDCDNFVITGIDLENALDFIAICRSR